MSREGFVCGTLDRIGASNKWAGCAANAPAAEFVRSEFVDGEA